MKTYKAPVETQIGHIHLKVSDLKRALKFYSDLLGFEITTHYGDQAVFLSAGGYHHHIGLNTWHSKNGIRPERNTVGLFHVALVYPTRKDLAKILKRLNDQGYPITGTADHGVSEAIYLDDPDGNGIELYWDKPKDQWPSKEDGSLEMYTKSLDVENLLNEIN
ncbi:MAG: VOC family protein [Flavobacteriaceae bacterium]